MHKCDFVRDVDWGKYEYNLKAFITKDRKAYAKRSGMWQEFSPKRREISGFTATQIGSKNATILFFLKGNPVPDEDDELY